MVENNRKHSHNSLKKRILLYLLIVLFFLLALVGTGVSYFTYLAERNAWQIHQGEATSSAAYRVSMFLNNMENSLIIVSHIQDFSSENYILENVLNSCPSFSEITCLDENGEVIATSSQNKSLLTNPYTIQQSNWFISAVDKKKFISDIQISPQNEPYLIMAIPSRSGGVIAARIDMRILEEVVRQIEIREINHSYIINPESTVIASSNPELLPVGANIQEKATPTALPIEMSLDHLGLQMNYSGQTVLSSKAPVPGTDWLIVTETPCQDALSRSRLVITNFLIGMVLFCFLLILGTSRLLTSMFFKPLEILRAGSQRAGSGDLDFQIQLKNNDEIGKLADSFNEMISNLKTRENLLTQKTNELAQEISEREKIEGQLIHEAYFDALTNLPNRAMIVDRLKISIARSKRNDENLFAVLFLDLDRFKVINDSLGHGIGDRVLVEVADRLKSTTRDSDTIARFGGDEFVILLEDVDDIQDIMHAVTHIQSSIAQKFILDQNEIYTSVSIGIVTNTQNYQLPEEFLRDADIALHRAKMLGQSRYAIFDPKMHSWAVKVQKTEADLRNALVNDEFVLYYQPVLTLDQGMVQGFEALIRWQHPQLGLLLPGEFIPIAEDTDIIINLGNWVLKEACNQLGSWRKQFPAMKTLTVSVNIPGKHLKDPDFIYQVQSIVKETGIEPSQLILEITERSLLELSDHVIQTLADLKASGVRLHLDDFGTGYSSLSVLHEYPIDSIKIDRSFIHRLSTDASSIEIVRAILQLGTILKKEVITEGIETEREIEVLLSLGCNYGQGFYFSHPESAKTMEIYLSSKNHNEKNNSTI